MTVTAILPSSIVQPASRAARVWCVARSLDHPINGGNGSGLIRISLSDLCYWLRRSTRSVWRYISDAKSKGYFHRCDFAEGIFTIEYRGLKSLCRHLGLESIGSIGEFALAKVQHASTFATDLVLEQLQGQSDFIRKQEAGKKAEDVNTAYELLDENTSSVRVPGEVITRGKRLLYLSFKWLPFGGCQKTIADRLGTSVRTVQNRVSNTWRNERGIPSINKRQTAQLVKENCSKDFFKEMLVAEDEPNRLVRLGRRVFRVGCNLYDSPSVMPRSQRSRKIEYWVEGDCTTKSTGRRACSTSVITLNSFEVQEIAESEKSPQTARL